MKKHLLCTSAIIGCAMAAPATAQQWDLAWGGFMSQHVAYADISGTLAGTGPGQTDNDGIGFHSTTEIIFTPSVTLDNGLTFGINVQLEGENAAGNYIDESYMSISGDTLGRIDIGAENSAGYKSMVAAPEVTSMSINSPSVSAFIPLTGGTGGPLPGGFRGAMLSAYTEVGRNNDTQRITYYTPSFNGLTVGVSYARNNGTGAGPVGNANNNNVAAIKDIFDIGVNYSQTFGTTSVNIGARYGTGDNTAAGMSDAETWGIGAQIGFGDFTVGGHYAENDTGAPASFGDQEGWSFGGTYDAPGPWAFEALTFQGKSKGTGAGGANEEYIAYRIGASRDLGPGVDWDIYAIWAEADDKGTAATEIDGTVIGTAINLSF